MVPIAPSATMTRRDNCSRNAWALVVVVLVMRQRSQWRSGMQDCASYDFSAGGPAAAPMQPIRGCRGKMPNEANLRNEANFRHTLGTTKSATPSQKKKQA